MMSHLSAGQLLKRARSKQPSGSHSVKGLTGGQIIDAAQRFQSDAVEKPSCGYGSYIAMQRYNICGAIIYDPDVAFLCTRRLVPIEPPAEGRRTHRLSYTAISDSFALTLASVQR